MEDTTKKNTTDAKKADDKTAENVVNAKDSKDVKKFSDNRQSKGFKGNNFKGGGGQRRRRPQKEDDGFDQKIVDLARVTRVMKGGKRMRFRATVVVGNKAGKVAVGTAKSIDVTNAIAKATERAKKDITTVQIINGSIAHDIRHKYGAARIMMKSAKPGTGIIAGGAMRTVFELAGINNVVGKIQGSNNKVNIVKCVIEGFHHLKQVEVKTEEKKPVKNPSVAKAMEDKKEKFKA